MACEILLGVEADAVEHVARQEDEARAACAPNAIGLPLRSAMRW